jgi:hypothetical protein
VTSCYTAELTAFMAKTVRFLPVNNLKELRERSTATWITVRGTALESFIMVCINKITNFQQMRKVFKV